MVGNTVKNMTENTTEIWSPIFHGFPGKSIN